MENLILPLTNYRKLKKRNKHLEEELIALQKILSAAGEIHCYYNGDDTELIEEKVKFETELDKNNKELALLEPEIKKIPKRRPPGQKMKSQYKHYDNEGEIIIREPVTVNKIRINSIQLIIEEEIIESIDVPLMPGWGMSMLDAEPNIEEIAITIKELKRKFPKTKMNITRCGTIKYEQIL